MRRQFILMLSLDTMDPVVEVFCLADSQRQ